MTPLMKRLAVTSFLTATLALAGVIIEAPLVEAKSSIHIGVNLGGHHGHGHHVRKHHPRRHYRRHHYGHDYFRPYFCSHHYMRHDYDSHRHYHGYGPPTNHYHPSNEGRYHKRHRRHVSVWRY